MNKLTIIKVVPLIILLLIIVVFPDYVITFINLLIDELNQLIVNKGLFILFYYILILGLVLLVLKYMFKRIWERFKIKYMAPINTFSKGKAKWSTKREMNKGYVKVDYDNSYTGGIIVNRVCELYILGKYITSLNFYKVKEDNKIQKMNEKFSKTTLTNEEIKKILKKYKKKTILDRFKVLEQFKIVKLKDVVYLDVNPINQLIIGTTRSGKSQTDILPQIHYWINIKNYSLKPNMIISDPKGELFNITAGIAIETGYDIKILNLSNINMSTPYNPLNNILNEFKKLTNDFDGYLYKEVKLTSNIIKQRGFTDIYRQKYREYLNQLEMTMNIVTFEEYIKQKTNKSVHSLNKDELSKLSTNYIEYKIDIDNKDLISGYSDKSLIQKEIDLVVNNLIPIESKDPFWELSAQNLLTSFIFYVLEESFIKQDYTYFNLYNVIAQMKVLLEEDEDGNSKYKELINKLPVDNYSRMTYPNASGKTLDSIITMTLSKTKIFNQIGLGKLTTYNEMDMIEFAKGNKPTIIYLITPDYDPSLNKLVSLFIDQIYLVAVKYADNNGGKLRRKLHFMLDEFANIPKIENITNKLTVCLGRNIQFSIAVQEIVQIEEKYGKEMSETIISNMHLKKYILAGKKSSLEFFSKEIGNTTVVKPNISYDKKSNMSVSYSEESIELITSEELSLNPMGKMIITNLRKKPAKMNSRPAFEYIINKKDITNVEKIINKGIINNNYINLKSNEIIFK